MKIYLLKFYYSILLDQLFYKAIGSNSFESIHRHYEKALIILRKSPSNFLESQSLLCAILRSMKRILKKR